MAQPARTEYPAASRDEALQARVRRQAVDVLSHQLQVERAQAARATTVDLGIAALLFGLGVGAASLGRGSR